MNFWISLLGYQLVWFTAVVGAGQRVSWPALLGLALFASWQWAWSRQRKTDAALMAAAVALGCMLDGGLLHFGLIKYVPAWPLATMAPAWILARWAAFALTFTQSLKWLQTRLWMALLLGAAGGPLAYLGASRWRAVMLAQPSWLGLLWLAAGWGLATPLLAWLARRWSHAAAPISMSRRSLLQ